MAFLDSNLHTQLAIVTKNELGLAFPPRNLPKKFRPDPSTFYLVIVVTNKQTDRQTNAGKNIIPRLCRDNYDYCFMANTQVNLHYPACSVKNWTILLVQSFTTRMHLLMATNA